MEFAFYTCLESGAELDILADLSDRQLRLAINVALPNEAHHYFATC